MLAGAGWLLSTALLAQSDLPGLLLPQLSLPAGWKLAGLVSTTADGAILKTQPGNTLLVGSGGLLPLATPTNDFRMRFELLTAANTDLLLQLPTGQTLSFSRERDLARLLKAPGLWQTVELWFKTGQTNHPSILEKLVLNGVTVREGQTLSGLSTGSVGVVVPTGTVAIRQVGYRVMLARSVAQWSGPLSYTLYEGESDNRNEVAGKKILKQDTTSVLTHEVTYGQTGRYSVLFSGQLNALNAGEYQFDLHQGGVAGLWVDGKAIIPEAYQNLSQPTTARATLPAGLHSVEVFFTHSRWDQPGLGLFVSQTDTRPQPLHALASLPDPDPVAIVQVTPETKSELVRSFVQMPGEKTKRTHSLSVGSPTGVHYTVDLNQMALLQMWKGDFANVTNMWHERGEPQLLEPMGTTIHLPAQPPLMVLTNETTNWPDSLDENKLHYTGLTVNKQGAPTFGYAMGGLTITDAVRAETDGLRRTLLLTGLVNGTIYCRVAAGSSIDEVSKGLYAIDDRSYYIRFDPKAVIKRRQSNGKQELLLPVVIKNSTGSVQYSVVF